MGADLRTALGFQYAAVRRWARAVAGGLEPGDWLVRLPRMRNHAHWIYGHVGVSSDIAPGVAEVEPLVPAGWRDLFDQGTEPDPEGSGYPSPGEIADLVDRAMNRNLEVIGTLDPRELVHSPRIALHESIRDFLRTRERWLAFAPLHLSYHLGQIRQIQRTLHPDSAGL